MPFNKLLIVSHVTRRCVFYTADILVKQVCIPQLYDWLFCGCLQFLTIILYRYLSICGCLQFLTIIFYRYLTEILWLSSIPQEHTLKVSDSAFCGFPQFLRIKFYKNMIEIFVAVLSSSGSYSTGVRLSLLRLSSVPQAHNLQVSDWAWAKAGTHLKFGMINKSVTSRQSSW